jgi:hypothetical protein
MFFDVRLDGHEVLVNEGSDFLVGVRFGLQPNASASSRGGAEINEQRFLRRLCFFECRVRIFVPLHSHNHDPPELDFSLTLLVVSVTFGPLYLLQSLSVNAFYQNKKRNASRWAAPPKPPLPSGS